MTAEGAVRISEEALALGFSGVVLLALQDFAPLAGNRFDMPLYGPDLSELRRGRFRRLGGVASRETLERMILEYAPGLDQPGDFSERQERLFDGRRWVRGDIEGHLRSALDSLELLATSGVLEPWQAAVVSRRMAGVRSALRNALI